MFVEFFYYLRSRGLQISVSEWMVLLDGIEKGLHGSSLEGFYLLCRSVILRDESEFDLFDQAFSEFFREILEGDGTFPEEYAELAGEDVQDLLQTLREDARASERREEAFFGEGLPGAPGKGKSAPGPGSGSAGGRTAVFAPGSRRFRDFRKDNTLDTRQFQNAFRILRSLSTQLETSEEEFDIDGTISETCRKGGLLHVRYRKPRRNTLRVILLIDSGGSMNIYARLCSALFQAATASRHLKELRIYYFHNVVYAMLYRDPTLDMAEERCTSVDRLMEECDGKYRVIFVGDAEMHPYELEGTEYNFVDNRTSLRGSETLRLMRKHFPHMIWLNPVPMPEGGDPADDSHLAIARIVDMYDLTLDGLERGFHYLLSGKK